MGWTSIGFQGELFCRPCRTISATVGGSSAYEPYGFPSAFPCFLQNVAVNAASRSKSAAPAKHGRGVLLVTNTHELKRASKQGGKKRKEHEGPSTNNLGQKRSREEFGTNYSNPKCGTCASTLATGRILAVVHGDAPDWLNAWELVAVLLLGIVVPCLAS